MDDIKPLSGTDELISNLVALIALSLSTGESFLPNTAAYDDLFYKLVETGDTLVKFRDAYGTVNRTTSECIDTLISVSRHYHALLENEGKSKSKNKTLKTEEVHKIIQQGYETLSINMKDGLDQWNPFREADHRNTLKRLTRIALDDAKTLLSTSL